MSPLMLISLLMASPIFSGSHFGGEFPSNWESNTFEPSFWSNTWESSPVSWTPEWFGEHSSVTPFSFEHEPIHFNSLIRRSTLSPRSILRELTGRRCHFNEESLMTPTLNKVDLIRIVKIVRRLAETNPIVLEKIIRCPEVRFFVEKMLRTVEPESLFAIEKLIRSVIPVEVREKITRRLIKNLIKHSKEEFSPLFHSHSRRSILSELLYTPESSIFSEVYSPESKVMSKVIRRLVKSNVFEEPKHEKVSILKKLIKKALRHELPVEHVTLLRKVCEHVCTPFSYSTPSVCRVCEKLVRPTRFESSIFESPIFEESYLNKEVLPFEFEKVNKEVKFCNFCNTVCEPSTWSIESHSTLPVCRVCDTVCHGEENIFGLHKLSKKITKSSPLSWF